MRVVLLAVLVSLSGCASSPAIFAKDECADLEVYGTVISTHWKCQKK